MSFWTATVTEREAVERLVAAGFEEDMADYAVNLIVQEGLALEGMVMLLVAQANPKLDSIEEVSQ